MSVFPLFQQKKSLLNILQNYMHKIGLIFKIIIKLIIYNLVLNNFLYIKNIDLSKPKINLNVELYWIQLKSSIYCMNNEFVILVMNLVRNCTTK